MTATSSSTVSREQALRAWNKILGAWHVCDNASCRRARACRGNASLCGPTNFARLPQGVQDWFCALVIAKQHDLSWDEAMARIARMPEPDAFSVWHESIAKGRPTD